MSGYRQNTKFFKNVKPLGYSGQLKGAAALRTYHNELDPDFADDGRGMNSPQFEREQSLCNLDSTQKNYTTEMPSLLPRVSLLDK
jgi:hypothetical protein